MRLFNSLFAICTSPIIHPVPPPPPQPKKKNVLYDLCLWFLLGDSLAVVPGEIEDNDHAKFWGGAGGRAGQTRCTMGDVQMANSLISTYQIVRALWIGNSCNWFFFTCMAIKTDLQYWSFGSKSSNSHSRYIIYHKCMYKA